MPTEEINILNIDVEPSQPEGFDVQLDLQQPNSPILSLGVVLPIGEGGAIKSISVNGVEQPIIDGNVDITVPTSTSQLLNDSGFITSAAISEKVDRTELAQVAFTGDYDDLENKPEIPSLDGYATETYVGNAIATHNSSSEAHSDIRGNIAAINSKIPSQATPDNQLADKNFVNSSISTETATFRGTYNEVTDLNLAPEATHSMIETALHTTITTVDNNDYVFVQIPTRVSTPDEIASVERYKYSSIYGWQYEYTLNNSGFTAAQWAAINSGITTGLVTQIGTSAEDITTIQSAITQLNTDVSGKVSKAGDTMTGGLLLDASNQINWIGAYRGSSGISKNAIWFRSDGAGVYFGYLNSTYTAPSTAYARIGNDGLILNGTRGVFENNSTTEENRLQRYDKIFTTGIVSDTKTWAGNTYTVSNPVTGPIPNDFIETVTLIGANFNATTLYFELNGLLDITYEEMRRIYEYSPKVIYGVTWQFMFGDSSGRKKFRTNFFNYPTSTSWGNCNINNIARANTTIETISLVQDTLKPSWESVIEAGYTFDSVNAINLNTYGYMWQGSQSWSNAFDGCTRLKHIDGILRFALSTSTAARADVFKSCTNLETVWVHMLDHNLSFEDSPYLKLDCLQFIVAKKYNATNAVTVTVHQDCYTRCQADTKQYTHSGQTYTGIIAYAAAKGLTITN